jgi:hypothetical protein
MGAIRPAVSLVLLLSGCKAQPTGQTDGAPHDLASDDGVGGDGAQSNDDLTGLTDLSCPMAAAEICGNGCDDDRNGFTDDDDPACTPQVLATWDATSMELDRLILQPPYRARFLDGNSVPTTAHGVYNGKFAPGIAFLAIDNLGQLLYRVTLPAGGVGKGAVDMIPTSYYLRDLCVFNGELIVVEQGTPGRLHRLKADATTEIGTVQLANWSAPMRLSACASDGTFLYVAEHSGISPTQFEKLDESFAPLASPAPISDQLLNDGIDRCLDFAWTKSGFYGLFIDSGGSALDDFSANQIRPFALDGAVGPPIDAGTLHGIGEFRP